MLAEFESSRQAEAQRELSCQESHGKLGSVGAKAQVSQPTLLHLFSQVIHVPQRTGFWQCPGSHLHLEQGTSQRRLDTEAGKLPWALTTRHKSQELVPHKVDVTSIGGRKAQGWPICS